MSPKDADGMANSVDQYQTAPSGLFWIYTVYQELFVRKLRSLISTFVVRCLDSIIPAISEISSL